MKFLKIAIFLLMPIVGYAQGEKPVTKKKNKLNMGVQATLMRGPYIQVPTSNSLIIRWRTDVLDRSRVKYGFSPDQLTMHQDDSLLVIDHSVSLKGLQPNTKYYYSIGNLADTTLQSSAENYFTTLPAASSEGLIRIAALGDMGNDSKNQKDVRDQVYRYGKDNHIHSMLMLGDNAYRDGSDAEFQHKFFKIYQDSLLKNYGFYAIPGNHDYHDIVSSPSNEKDRISYFSIFDMPIKGEVGGIPSGSKSYYSFDLGNIHFIALDSYGKDENGLLVYNPDGKQVEWLKKDLAAKRDQKWTIVLIHHPPYSKGSHDSDKESALVKIRENLNPILESYGVDMVLSGHSHIYERTKLIHGYYGMEKDYIPKKYEVSSSTGRADGSKNSAPYHKGVDNKGTVYAVIGSSGQLGGVSENFPHAAHFYSNNDLGGAAIIESDKNRLMFKWLAADGDVKDQLVITKD